MAEDPVTVSWKPTILSANASNNVIPMHGATQDVLDSGGTNSIVQTKETAPLNRCEEHAQGPLAELKSSGRRICACPPQGIIARIATNVVAIALIWAVFWSITTHESLPGGSLFGFLFLYLFAVIGGKIMGLIKFPGLPPLPPLLGMLLVGFLLRNIPLLTDIVLINVKWGATLRSIALSIILARAGLGLDPKALKKLKAVCFRLSLGPCLIEACTAAVISHFLMHLPWQWGFMLGFVLGAVSPAVVVPSMLVLQAGGYGVDKGVPTLLMAAGSFDDILAITGFNTCLGIAFSSGSTLENVLRGVLEVAVGIAAGGLLGIFIRYFPSKDQTYLVWKRAFFIIGLSMLAIFGSMYFGFPGSGGLCTIVLAFLAGLSWSDEKKEVEKIIKAAWEIFQPFLFGLIGAEISVASLDPQTVGLCIAVLVVGLIARVTATFILVFFAGFELKERIFIALAWIPKATVQAAIGSVALDTAREQADKQLEKYGMDVLTVAFLAILITAPIGALIIGLAGPKLLHKTSDTNRESHIYEEREEIEIQGPA
ncbi:sodium/hydrogen exchanger 9B2-like [Crotalus tigris]|uniref:sodium/hydrogen exchanger 9B2-like n=1 Tax=Crotalus tigris TaxID=88082 RepID=UPI00192F3FF0|nr:sodium/hydrogen exchanger 9B2-like [Crotalus tigris]XP_039206625.1 sodium/hydrogen exchanger 9B2-like [Crotalus tigris]XP_039206626.1 sodium/hydrogen exchanger 9B2-like [Crotalus tigris]